MSGKKNLKLLLIFVLLTWVIILSAQQIKVIVTVDDSSIKETPEISGETLAKVPMNTILSVVEKQGEWYKITTENEAEPITGYIHEMLVKEISDEEISQISTLTQTVKKKSESELLAEIEAEIETNKQRIRQGIELDQAVESLRPLIAQAFNISDRVRQKELAAETYLWLGLAYAGQNMSYPALQEIRNMFIIDHAYTLEITRNIVDTQITALINQAEKEYIGEITNYSIEVITQPENATIKINGVATGTSPGVFSVASPQLKIELERSGYEKITDDVFMEQEMVRKEYTLIPLGRNITIRTTPSEAQVFLDGKNTGLKSDCTLERISFGVHNIRLVKDNYMEWSTDIQLGDSLEPFAIEVSLVPTKYDLIGKWGGSASPMFQAPSDIAFDTESNFFVIDESRKKVNKYTPEGQVQAAWRLGGKGFPGLKNPAGIALDADNNIYITDAREHTVLKFNHAGVFLLKWGKEGNTPNSLKTPQGITVNSESEILLADTGNNCVKIFSNTGEFKKVIGKQGTSDGNFMAPISLDLDSDGNLFVIDRHRLQKFSISGEFLQAWVLSRLGDGKHASLRGIGLDRAGYLYLADLKNQIMKLDQNGELIALFGNPSPQAETRIDIPIGIALDESGNVYILDRTKKTLYKFGIFGK